MYANSCFMHYPAPCPGYCRFKGDRFSAEQLTEQASKQASLWIIRRTDQGGGYLEQSGSARTYTARRDKAQRFNSCESAQRHCCENETAEVL